MVISWAAIAQRPHANSHPILTTWSPPPAGQAISFTSLYLNSLSNIEAVERAAIPVEKTNGPVLLISAQDDAAMAFHPLL